MVTSLAPRVVLVPPSWHGDELGLHKLFVVALEDRPGELGRALVGTRDRLDRMVLLARKRGGGKCGDRTPIATSTNGNAPRDALDARWE